LGNDIRLVVMDMDGVIIDEYSSWVLVHRHFGTDNEDSLRAFLRGEIDDFEFIRRDVERWTMARGSVTVQEVLSVLDTAPLVKGAVETLIELHRHGIRTAIVSGGLRPLAERVGRMGQVTHVHANNVQVDRDGLLTGGGVVDVPLKGKGAVVAAIQQKEGISAAETAAIGDSLVDISMFELARLSIAFNPRDNETARAATHVVESADLRSVLPHIIGHD
jgi:phosphoserine phosphatase